jgi:uncharacterized integral membrane protein
MSKKVLIALILIALVVLVLLMNASGGSVDIKLFWTHVGMAKSLGFFLFVVLGVIIGALLM